MARPDAEATPPRIEALARQGGRIGLLGGSFNPAHGGHVHVSEIALRRFRLDAVWWIVSPQNPLKGTAAMAPLARRLERARAVARHPKLAVSAPEARLGTRYSADAIDALQAQFPQARFVWLIGGDNLVQFHRWRRWASIFRSVPVAVIARPGFTINALASPVARRLAQWRVEPDTDFADRRPPAWCFVQERLDPASATALRNCGVWR